MRRGRRDGSLKWAGAYVFIGKAMAGELVGNEAGDDDRWNVHSGPMHVGILHSRTRTVMPVGAA